MAEEKKTEAVTVKLSDTVKRFVDARYKQEGMESPGEYIRSLIEADRKSAADNFSLLAEALGIKVITDNHGNICQKTASVSE